MEIKKMRGRYVRIAPEHITHEVNEYVELADYYEEYECNHIEKRTEETDEEWKNFCKEQGNEPFKEECTYVNFNRCSFPDPYEVFKVSNEFYGMDMYNGMSGDFEFNEEKLHKLCKHQVVIDYHPWKAEYFEVVKKVEEVENEYLPKGVVKEIKTISWVRDEEFYN